MTASLPVAPSAFASSKTVEDAVEQWSKFIEVRPQAADGRQGKAKEIIAPSDEELNNFLSLQDHLTKFEIGCYVSELLSRKENASINATNDVAAKDGFRRTYSLLMLLDWACGNRNAKFSAIGGFIPFRTVLLEHANKMLEIASEQGLILDPTAQRFLKRIVDSSDMTTKPESISETQTKSLTSLIQTPKPLGMATINMDSYFNKAPSSILDNSAYFCIPDVPRLPPISTIGLFLSNAEEKIRPNVNSSFNPASGAGGSKKNKPTPKSQQQQLNQEQLLRELEDLREAYLDTCVRSELIMVHPEYPALRLKLSRAGLFRNDDNGHSSRPLLGTDPIQIFKEKAYVEPLLPEDEQLVVNALRGVTVLAGRTVKSNVVNEKDSATATKGNKSDETAKPLECNFDRRKLVEECGVEPSNLPLLVEKNPNIAIECLTCLLLPNKFQEKGSNESLFGKDEEQEYLSALVSMDMSIHSMEVVNKLATTPKERAWSQCDSATKPAVPSKAQQKPSSVGNTKNSKSGGKKKGGKGGGGEVGSNSCSQSSLSKRDVKGGNASEAKGPKEYLLPIDFLHIYVSSCIASCENIQDRYSQNRLVRLCCIFFQNLIQRNIVDIQSIFVEVQAFCIEFSRIREAVTLFKMLKDMEAGPVK